MKLIVMNYYSIIRIHIITELLLNSIERQNIVHHTETIFLFEYKIQKI